MRRISSCAFLALLAITCMSPVHGANPYASTYEPIPAPPTVIRNATILTGTGARLDGASILFTDGQVVAIGSSVEASLEDFSDVLEIDAAGRWITPGLIDVHSHLGVYATPSVNAHRDGNEMSNPVTAEVWAEHAIWPQDPGFSRALAGGVTTLQVLPGSANLIGGRAVTLKNVPAISYQAMKFPGAPQGLKMACGENPKRIYGAEKLQAPMTRMGNVAGYRAAWAKARDYMQDWADYDDDPEEYDRPERDLQLETLAAVLRGEILVHMHCYRADEMMLVLDMAQEFGYRVSAFHHGVETYKVASELAQAGVCAAIWAQWWGFKFEAYDGIQENIALTDRPEGSCAIVHSDSNKFIQRLNVEAAKAMTRGRRIGLDIPPERAIRWITANAARSLGIQDQTGTLEAGKMADIVIWNRNPFSVYALADRVYIDGAPVYDRNDPALQPVSDFELGQRREATP